MKTTIEIESVKEANNPDDCFYKVTNADKERMELHKLLQEFNLLYLKLSDAIIMWNKKVDWLNRHTWNSSTGEVTVKQK